MNLACFPASLSLTDVLETSERVVMEARDLRPALLCPDCGQPSRHLHSRYLRTMHDTALGGRAVLVHLQVRRLRCLNPLCERVTFAETWPEWLDARVQRTIRLAHVQQTVAMALGGEAGQRLLTQLHEGTSADTLLRFIRKQPIPEPPTLRVLGVDDFCFRRGKTYGTLLIDLERHQVVDVLADRTAKTLAEWLAAHPGIQIINRDRYGDYARGAATGAPNAQQIADRFHLLQNLRDVAEQWLKRIKIHVLHRQPPALPVPSTPASIPLLPEAHPFRQDAVPSTTSARVKRIIDRRAHRRALYERAAQLHAQGHSVSMTAKLTGVGRTTLQDWLKAPHFPGRATRSGALTPFVAYVRDRVNNTAFTGQQIFNELVAQGYRGQRSLVYELLEWLRQGHLPPSAADLEMQPQEAVTQARKPYSSKQGAWWFLQAPDTLSTTAREGLAHIQSVVEDSTTVYRLVQDFASLLRTRPMDASARLTAWLDQALTCTVLEVERFASGVQKDVAAVLGAMTSSWSNGQTEGQVNRVKMLKRQMYGRAKFDLLRARILLA